jgi:hypothetical protein
MANGETYRRNRLHLNKSKENADTPEQEVTPQSPEPSPCSEHNKNDNLPNT